MTNNPMFYLPTDTAVYVDQPTNCLPRIKAARPSVMLKASIFWLLAVGCVCGQTGYGTTGVMVWTPDRIIVGMDAKGVPAGGSTMQLGAICKIRMAGRFFYWMAGLYSDDVLAFDAWRRADSALKQARTTAEAASIFETAVLPELEQALFEVIISQGATRFAQTFARGDYLDFFVAGVESGILAVVGLDFHAGTNELISVIRQEVPGDRTGLSKAIVVFGDRTAIDRYYPALTDVAQFLEEHRALSDLSEAVGDLVQLEIDRGSGSAGAPKAVLEISLFGYKWQQPRMCQ